MSGKKLVVVVDDVESNITLCQIEDFAKHLGAECLQLPPPPVLDRRRKDVWAMVSCNALFDPKGVKNHWVPAFFQQQISEDQWFELTVVARNRIRVSMIEKKKMLQSSKETRTKMVEEKADESAIADIASMIVAFEKDIEELLTSKILAV